MKRSTGLARYTPPCPFTGVTTGCTDGPCPWSGIHATALIVRPLSGLPLASRIFSVQLFSPLASGAGSLFTRMAVESPERLGRARFAMYGTARVSVAHE